MNEKAATKYRIVFYICIALTLACLITGICTLHTVKQDGTYHNKYDVALYIYTYHKLPSNFITKSQADSMTAVAKKNYNIGGDTFENREGRIDNPNNLGLVECDIYTRNNNISKRGAERLVFFANGSKVFYTSNHYTSFTEITKAKINGVSYFMFAISGTLLIGQIVYIIVARKKNNKNAVNQWITALEVVAIVIVLVAISPILLILWIVGNIKEKKYKKEN